MKKLISLILSVIMSLLVCAFVFSACEDEMHTHDFSEEWLTDETHHWHVCTVDGCTEKSTYAEHDFTNGDCVCGKKKPTIEHQHTYSEEWSTDETHHWHVCTVDGCTEKSDYAEHDYTNGYCVCGQKAPHIHAWSSDWTKDETHHWHVCTVDDCTEKSDYAEHDYKNGYCVCGQKYTKNPTEGLAYELNEDNESYSVTSIGTASEKDIVVPNEYQGKPVTAIKEKAFENSNITSITLPENIASIGDDSFLNSKSLNSVYINGSITSAGEYSFYGCNELKGVYIESLTNWCNCNFKEDYSNPLFFAHNLYVNGELLTSLTVPADVTKIGYGVFRSCRTLNELVVGENVSEIGDYAFYDCQNLKNISIPDGLTYLSDSAFGNNPAKKLNEYKGGKYLGNENNPYVALLESIDNSTELVVHKDAKLVMTINSSALSSITVEEGNARFYSQSNCIIDKQEKVLVKGCKNSVIPSDADILKIGNSAFIYCVGIKDIIIPDTVVEIGEFAFNGCRNVNVVIGTNVKVIGASAFEGCYFESATLSSLAIKHIDDYRGYSYDNVYQYLQNLTVLDGEIVSGAFYRCSNLKTVSIEKDVTVIGYEAFRDCTLLSEITIADGATEIIKWAFLNCSSLISIVIPDSVREIGDYAFSNCGELTSVSLSSGLNSLGAYVFDKCNKLQYFEENGVSYLGNDDNKYIAIMKITSSDLTALNIMSNTKCVDVSALSSCGTLEVITAEETNENYSTKDGILYNKEKTDFVLVPKALKGDITVPETISVIGKSLFAERSGIVSITILSGVTEIKELAFSGCKQLTEVVIPESVTIIAENVFSNCNSLESIIVASDNENYFSVDGILYDKANEIVVVPKNISGTINVPEGVTSIGNVFANNKKITAVNLPSGIEIGYYAFRNCTSLESVSLPDDLSIIAESAFEGCASLKNLTLPSGLNEIGDNAFKNCSSIESIVFPDNLFIVGTSAFENCTSIIELTISENVETIGQKAFYGCSIEKATLTGKAIESISKGNLKEVVIIGNAPLGNFAFNRASALVSVTIGENVPSIGEQAFDGCTSIERIVIPDNVQSIGKSAFAGCVSLSEVEIGNGVTKILTGTFDGCNLLTTVNFGENVSEIEYNSFSLVSSVVTISVAGNVALPTELKNSVQTLNVIGDKNIGDFAYRNLSNLKFVTIGENVESIGIYSFASCTSLEKVSIAKGKVGGRSFDSCTSLTEVVLEEGVTEIGNFIFAGCTSLVTITLPSTITVIPKGAFDSCTSLESVRLPSTITSLYNPAYGDSAFRNCGMLREIYFEGSMSQWNSFQDLYFYNCTVYCSDGRITY